MSQIAFSRRQLAVYVMVATFVGLAIAGCKGKEIPSSWADRRIAVDGDMSDWSGLPSTHFEDENVSVSLANDNNNLYALFRFRDAKYARAITMSGLTLWLDAKGKKGKNFSICYKGGPTPDEMRPLGVSGDDSTTSRRMPMGGQGPMGGEGMMGRRPDSEMVFTCFIKDRISEKPIPTKGTEGPAAAFKLDKGTFVYEFSIPLEETRVQFYGIGAEPGANIGIGLEWGGSDGMPGGDMPRPGGGGGMGGPPGGGGGGMGGPPGGGMGGPPGGGMGGGRPDAAKAQEVWLKTVLASSLTTQQGDEQ